MAEPTRPPQWLFDEITMLPPEARGWALGFMCAGWLAGREDGAAMVVEKMNAPKRPMYLVPLDPPHPACGGQMAKQRHSTMFGSPGGFALSCASCDKFIMYVGQAVDRVTISDWAAHEAIPTERREVPIDTPRVD